MNESQEPKYEVSFEAKIRNRKTKRNIPDDEPIFIFRAKDRNALAVLRRYQDLCDDLNHRAVIGQRIDDFKKFEDDNPELMGEPNS